MSDRESEDTVPLPIRVEELAENLRVRAETIVTQIRALFERDDRRDKARALRTTAYHAASAAVLAAQIAQLVSDDDAGYRANSDLDLG